MKDISSLVKKFGPAEKLIFGVFAIVLIISGLTLIVRVNNLFLVEVPTKGGVLKEGMVGSPRFVNPVLAISDTDKAVAELVYGELVPNLADVAVSEDGLTYDVTLKEKVQFQNGIPVTTDDILFTIDKILNPVIKSPKKANFEGVVIEKVSDKKVRFILKKPYFPFLENLSLGILPKSVWKTITSEEFPFSDKNINPVGAGPYKISSVSKDASGLPVGIVLKPFSKYQDGAPKIGEIDLSFFGSELDAVNAYKSGAINALGGLSGEDALNLHSTNLISSIMPRIFGVFFNQNQASLFANVEVRKALDLALDKKAITDEITKGFGVPLSGPTPLDVWQNSSSTMNRIQEAKNILAKAGWKANKDGILEKKVGKDTYIFRFSISTSDVPELKRTGEILRDTWNMLGGQVDLKVFGAGDLNQNVLRPRKYDALLFGEVVGKNLDLYPFWHSSERLDPGLNISLYTNIKADKLLDDERNAANKEAAALKLASFKEELAKDLPAIFLYAPKYIYAISPTVKNVFIPEFGNPSDRFLSVNNWYIKTAKVWSIFAN